MQDRKKDYYVVDISLELTTSCTDDNKLDFSTTTRALKQPGHVCFRGQLSTRCVSDSPNVHSTPFRPTLFLLVEISSLRIWVRGRGEKAMPYNTTGRELQCTAVRPTFN